MYVYIKSERAYTLEGRYYPGLWTVGFYRPDGQWESESDYTNSQDAANRVHYLNGGEEVRKPVVRDF